MTVEVQVYAPDLTTPIGSPFVPIAASSMWERDETGAGEMTVPTGPLLDANPTLLDPGNFVVVSWEYPDGTNVRHGWIIETRSRSAQEGTWDEISVAGPGATALLRRAVVWPPRGLRRTGQNDCRLFGWMNRQYDDSAWPGIAYSHGQQQDPGPENLVGRPSGWPGPLAEWVWAEAPTPNPNNPDALVNPPGVTYFRRRLAGDYAGPARLFVTAANAFRLFWDGCEIADGTNYQQIKSVDLMLEANTTHLVAVEVVNQTPPDGWAGQNIGGFLMEIRRIDPVNGDLTSTALYRTFTTAPDPSPEPWSMLGYPEDVPGMTPGHILRILLEEEAQARGTLTQLTRMFNDELDSAGNPWPEIVVAFNSGDTLLDAALRLRDYDVQVEIDADLNFYAWQDRGDDLTGSAVEIPWQDASERAIETDDTTFTGLLVRSSDGWQETEYLPGERREGFILLGRTVGADVALDVATGVRDNLSEPRASVTFVTEPTAGDLKPLFAYGLGDTLNAPWVDPEAFGGPWATGPVRLTSIAVEAREGGGLRWTHEGRVGPDGIEPEESEPI